LLTHLEPLGTAGHGRKDVVGVHGAQNQARAIPRLLAESVDDAETHNLSFIYAFITAFPFDDAHLQLMTRLLEVPSRQLMQTQVK